MLTARLRPVVSTPYPRISRTAVEADEKVVVVLTQGRIARKHRAEFDRQTRRVAVGMAEQAGLLGYSIRRQVFGATVWTVTIWKSDADRVRFSASATHRQAIERSGVAVLAMRSWRADVDFAQIPAGWAEALAMFADAESAR